MMRGKRWLCLVFALLMLVGCACAEKDGRKLPILLVSGAEDPVGNYGEGVRVVWEKLQKAGADVQIKLYMDCRHEILNDTCREETIRDILAFLC